MRDIGLGVVFAIAILAAVVVVWMLVMQRRERFARTREIDAQLNTYEDERAHLKRAAARRWWL